MDDAEAGVRTLVHLLAYFLGDALRFLNRQTGLHLNMQPGVNCVRPNILRPQIMHAQHTRHRAGQPLDLRQMLRPRRAAQQEGRILPEQANRIVGDDRG